MENIETHPDFNLTNKSFEEEKNLNTNNGYWTMFLNIHKTISKNRCPVCEELLDQKGIRETLPLQGPLSTICLKRSELFLQYCSGT